ncbi:hypothetical protein [Natronococcus wangiae]|uniref:hypothetical protein n=1 Tax=Natronococcus wangiae TaxID=3068275 RepID=UPI00273DAA1B|nr:hypothetical protein [Natronococcus sp. AD5]
MCLSIDGKRDCDDETENDEVVANGIREMNAADDEIVTDLVSRDTSPGETEDTATGDDVTRALELLLEAISEEGAESTGPVGVIGFVESSRDPDDRTGIGFSSAYRG